MSSVQIKQFVSMALIVVTLMSSHSAECYDNRVAHPGINESAVVQSARLPHALMSLGFNGGVETVLVGSKIYKHFVEGGEREDEPDYRTSNHFHDPLRPWDKAGLNGSLVGKSSLIWAQSMRAEGVLGRNDWSWPKAREFYYSALTLRERSKRDENLARTFQAVGQAMHLLSDTTVPAHVRNDAHILAAFGMGWNYESWAKSKWDRFIRNNNLHIGKKVDESIFNANVPNAEAPVPISALWDKNVYLTDGSNPQVTWTTNPSISEYGLAEYTNANFFSEDTIFADYPHPRKDNTTARLVEQYAKDGKLDRVWYAMGYQTERLAAYSYFSEIDSEKAWKYHLDDFVYQDYAKKLIPRAVGYSTALLDYFFLGDIRLEYTTDPRPGYVIVNKTDEDMNGLFQILYDNQSDQRVRYMSGNFSLGRQSSGDVFDITPPVDAKEPGKYILAFRGNMGNESGAVAGYVTSRLLEITPPAQYIYAKAAGDDGFFSRIRASVKNANSAEQMQAGTILMVARYKADTYDSDFIYSVSEAGVVDLSRDLPREVEFNFDNDPIPVNATDLYLEVVFNGRIGSEDWAIATGTKDLWEPTPIDVFNNTDKSCVNGGWHDTAEAIDLVDKNRDGAAGEWNEHDVYPHILQDIYIKISLAGSPQEASPSAHDAIVPTLNPGEFRRVMHILTENSFKYSSRATWIPQMSEDKWSHLATAYTFSGVAAKNQMDYTSDPAVCGFDPFCYIYRYSAYYSIRGNSMWWAGGVVFTNRPYPVDSSCQGY